MSMRAGGAQSLSPSMDIQVSSNFERLLFELLDRDPAATPQTMRGLPHAPAGWRCRTPPGSARATVFHGFRLDDAGTEAEIRRLYASTGYLADPHTAIGIAAARAPGAGAGVPTVAMATAHPAKFPDAIEQAVGWRPPLPPRLADLYRAGGALPGAAERAECGGSRRARADATECWLNVPPVPLRAPSLPLPLREGAGGRGRSGVIVEEKQSGACGRGLGGGVAARLLRQPLPPAPSLTGRGRLSAPSARGNPTASAFPPPPAENCRPVRRGARRSAPGAPARSAARRPPAWRNPPSTRG